MAEQQEKNIITERTKEYGKQFWGILQKQIEKQTDSDQDPVSRISPPKKEGKYKILLKLLFLFPLLLIGTFITSFYWDFDGVQTTVLGFSIEFEGLMRILSISGLIGFLTNWLAITMLFRPAKRRPIFGQGLVPAQKDRIAFRLAAAVSEDLINPDIIKQKIQESNAISKYRAQATEYIREIIDDPEFRTDLKALAVNYVDEMVAQPEVRANIAESIIHQIENNIEENSFEKVALKAYSFIKGQEMQSLVEDALTKLPGGVEKGLDKLDSFLDTLPDKIEANSSTIENIVTSLLYKLINQLDVHALVEDNLREYDEQRLEKLIKNASNDQLQYIQYLGAVLGTLGGFIIWKPIGSLVLLLLIISITLGLDILLHWIKNRDSIS
ncbi:MAG: DUF445 family protein [Balneola sp.]|nr:DUF445 family protein [Balneola sp.]MBO6651879.1 DUF445 family protein [Balneola sp.]MBO6710402.1 DUF445 family protein [Balneola sp.]MBO6799087.1 DUF445 family protein [Balneola sp.]MBO6870927.1 DUF445 family protein [Balneola sp.]